MMIQQVRNMFVLLFCLFLTAGVFANDATTEKYEILMAEHASTDQIETTTIVDIQKNKTLSELVKEQTEAIKKFLAERKPTSRHPEYVAPAPATNTTKSPSLIKREKERESIEALKQKCDHFYKYYRKHSDEQRPTTTERPRHTVQPFGPPIKPQFFNYRPKYPQNPPPFYTESNMFIFGNNKPDNLYAYKSNNMKDAIEAAGSDNEEVKVPYEEEAENVDEPTNYETTTHKIEEHYKQHAHQKFVRLDPLVLQKTTLTNGKQIFYWYRHHPHTPNFVQIPDTPDNQHIEAIAQPNFHHHPNNIPIPEEYKFYVDPTTGNVLKNHKTHHHPMQPPKPYHAQSQFFINPQNGMVYQSAAPHQYIYHQRPGYEQPEMITTPATPSVPEYSVEYTPTSETDEALKNFRHEYRFVIPLPVADKENIAKYPYQLDPYAYFPKQQQPPLMNIAVPYMPNYHTIHTLNVPKTTENVHEMQSHTQSY